MRAEYFRLSALGHKDADLVAKLKEAYHKMVDRTDPLHRHRGDRVPEKWDCPKVSDRGSTLESTSCVLFKRLILGHCMLAPLSGEPSVLCAWQFSPRGYGRSIKKIVLEES